MAAKLAESIDLRDVGPIEKLSLPVPAGGGLVVLRARNGKGKTKALEAVETVLTGRGKLEVRDKALRGEVEAFGVHLTVAKSTRKSGELEVVTLDGKLSVAELVDPGIKSHDAADAKRIKALVALSGVKPADLAAQFRELLGGRTEFETVVRPESLTGDDAVAAADKVKRDIEAAARKEEDQAQHADGRAQANSQAATGVDLKAECDADVLQKRLEDAIAREADLKSRQREHYNCQQSLATAKQQLADAKDSYTGPSVADAEVHEQKRLGIMQRAVTERDKLKAMLATAEAAVTDAGHKHELALAELTAAKQHNETIRQWQEQVSAPLPAGPDDDALAAAATAVTEARQALEQAAVVRKAQQHLLLAQTAQEEALQHASAAAALRESAKGVDEVLSSAVARLSGQLRVEAGRLVLDTQRGATYFSDLSHGERWKIALDIAIDALGESKDRGVIVLPQPAYEGLDDENRRLVAAHLKERGVVGITAECSDDESIVAEVFA